MEAIRQWLAGGKHYLTGAALYLEHGNDREFIRLLTTERETPFKKKRLEALLRAILAGTEKPTPKPAPALSIKSWPAEEATDEILTNLRQAWLADYRTMQDIRSRLMDAPNDDVRGEMAHQILRLDDKITAIQQKRDYYKQHGRLPDVEEPELVSDPHKAALRVETLKRYIRREKRALEKDPGNTKIITRIENFKLELNGYSQRFGITDSEA